MMRMAIIGIAAALCLQAGPAPADPMAEADAADHRAAYDAWYGLALNGDVAAQQRVAELQESGLGVAQSASGAFLWYQIADFDPNIDLTQKLAELSAQLTPAEQELAMQSAYARSIEILAARNAPPPAPTGPKAELQNYTWFCDCGPSAPPSDDEDHPDFDLGIGSKFTF
jgi:hypothetical protein